MTIKKSEPAATVVERETREVAREGEHPHSRAVPVETPLAIVYNGLSHAVMMVTPADLEDFAVGFTLSEGIAKAPDDIKSVEIRTHEEGLVAEIEIAPECFEQIIEGRRNLVGQTGCGLCGIEDLEHAIRSFEPLDRAPALDRQAIFRAVDGLREHQNLNRQTGAVHAAGFVTPEGEYLAVREDVGRHNALDKLIGFLVRSGRLCEPGMVVLSSRCSFELVQKMLAVRLSVLVTISAPTSLAMDLAERYRLTLIALARSDSMLLINDPFNRL